VLTEPSGEGISHPWTSFKARETDTDTETERNSEKETVRKTERERERQRERKGNTNQNKTRLIAGNQLEFLCVYLWDDDSTRRQFLAMLDGVKDAQLLVAKDDKVLLKGDHNGTRAINNKPLH
jgi:hypothetical protein